MQPKIISLFISKTRSLWETKHVQRKEEVLVCFLLLKHVGMLLWLTQLMNVVTSCIQVKLLPFCLFKNAFVVRIKILIKITYGRMEEMIQIGMCTLHGGKGNSFVRRMMKILHETRMKQPQPQLNHPRDNFGNKSGVGVRCSIMKWIFMKVLIQSQLEFQDKCLMEIQGSLIS